MSTLNKPDLRTLTDYQGELSGIVHTGHKRLDWLRREVPS